MDESIPKKPPDQFVKDINVLLLKNRDFRGEDGKPFMPTDGERSTLQRRTYLGQYKSKVRFHASMSSDMVKKKLQEIFPYLKSRSFYTCAAVKLSNQGKRFEYHGSPRIWDGKTILDKLKWNSALYILEDEASLQSETELSSTDILEGGDDDMNSIATDTNQASSQSETELSSTNILQGGDDDMNSIATYTNQMFDSSDEVFSSTNNATSSGISGSEPEFSKDVTDMSSLLQWLQDYLHFDIIGNPNYSHLKGGGPIIFTFTPPLPSAVTSVRATFEWLGTRELKKVEDGSWLGYFPASPVPAVINVMLKSQNNILLGQTKVTYGVNLQQVVSCPSELQKFCENYYDMHHGSLSGNPGTSGGETENSRNLGFKQQVQMLCLMIYVAAECGAQQSLEIIFTSSAGIVAFNAYKNNLTLPEVIARDHGNTETANYLEGITKRFSEEIRTGKKCSQTIDWSELAKAAEAAQKQHAIKSEEENYQLERNIPKEAGYLGDVDTSSSESSEPHSSDSEDDISTTSSNGSVGQRGEIQLKKDLLEDRIEIETEAKNWKQPDHSIKTTKASLSQTPIWVFKDGKFEGMQVNVKIKPLNWEQNPLHLISDHLVQEAHNRQQLKCLHLSCTSFLLGLGEEPVQHHLITGYERLGNLLKSTKERNTYCMMHTGTAEDRPSLGNSSIMVGYNDDHKSSSMDSLLQLYRRLFNEDSLEGPESQKDCFPEFTTTPTNENLTMRRKSTEFSTERCHSTAPPGVWMLTYKFCPTRKTFFVYAADSKDALYFPSCFDDEEYKLSTLCWQWQRWQRCLNNLFLVSKTDFGSHKARSSLPKDISIDQDIEMIAQYQEDISKRSEGFDVVTGKECLQSFRFPGRVTVETAQETFRADHHVRTLKEGIRGQFQGIPTTSCRDAVRTNAQWTELPPFRDEHLNYFKITSIVMDEFPKALRQVFKSKWDDTFGCLPGFQLWDDSTLVRDMFHATEGGQTKVPKHLSFEEWGFTSLYQAIICSRSFALPDTRGQHRTLRDLYVTPRQVHDGRFHASVVSPEGNDAESFALAIDQLRLLRNSLCHSLSCEMENKTFGHYLQLAKDAFKVLGVTTNSIDAVGGLTESEAYAESFQESEGDNRREFPEGNNFLEVDKLDDLMRNKELATKVISLPRITVPHITGQQGECKVFTSSSSVATYHWSVNTGHQDEFEEITGHEDEFMGNTVRNSVEVSDNQEKRKEKKKNENKTKWKKDKKQKRKKNKKQKRKKKLWCP